jgi:hypothetical protein
MLEDVLRELIQRLGSADDGTISWEQVRAWPEGALEAFLAAGWLKPTAPAASVECPGCEENCFMPARVLPASNERPARAYVVCDRRDDMGRVKIPLVRLQQWQLTHGQVARWVSRELGLKAKPQKDGSTGLYKLGIMPGKDRLGLLELSVTHPASLSTSGHSLPLQDVLFIDSGRLVIERSTVIAMIDMPPITRRKAENPVKKPPKVHEGTDQQPGPEIGSKEWRKQNARNAANARHDKPGGSHDKQRQIREIWASGKYTTRERCAEEESGALGMSFSAALKALRNTPDPNRASHC